VGADFVEVRDERWALGSVKVVFVNGVNNQAQHLAIAPDDRRIGVTCEQCPARRRTVRGYSNWPAE
jgi:hypothetical protein